MRKPAFCICEKDADWLHGQHAADQCLCFCYIDSTIPLLSNLIFRPLKTSSVVAITQTCLCYILQYFTAVKTIIFRRKIVIVFLFLLKT